MLKAKSRIHIIATGGSAMHNLALMLHRQGHQVTGSDDQFFDPSKSRLEKEGLLPDKEGWFPEKITEDIDLVLVGNHAKNDNPELLRARELELKVLSLPDFIMAQSQNKHRIVVAGSHGKTTVTSMIMHVLKAFGLEFDYMVGSEVQGFDLPIKITESAPVLVVEGDEYGSAPDDPTPKFLKYEHHVLVLTGIAWDHANMYPTYDEYVTQFEKLGNLTPKAGHIVFNEDDALVAIIARNERSDVTITPYNMHPYKVEGEQVFLETEEGAVPVPVFGEHNMYNFSAAFHACTKMGIPAATIYEAFKTYTGAKRRLERLGTANGNPVFRDFAHAPSKVTAVVQSVAKHFKNQKVAAIYELHTYSSLSDHFLPEYKDSMNPAAVAAIYYDPSVSKHKDLPVLDAKQIGEAFGRSDIQVIQDKSKLEEAIRAYISDNYILLFMSSGNFAGLDFHSFLD